ncbi:hypothetical protein KIPB_017101, partial [Kipferlia bialata]
LPLLAAASLSVVVLGTGILAYREAERAKARRKQQQYRRVKGTARSAAYDATTSVLEQAYCA